ncbi:oncoprotein-induced transcript 3 protein-like [Diadema setosum]|uniref:oncoprotein-induced transcript 3 protein-like n=1 Tax=Diadema setosum TaxID=31175 RepID=UPI003B39FD3E
MTLIIARSLLDVDDNAGDVHFEDESCVGYDHDINHIAVTTFYDECSTEQKQTEDNIVYTNTVTYYKPRPENGTDQVITREHDLQVPVTCLLEREEVLSESFQPNTGKVVVEEIGYGEFSLSLDRFEDHLFSKKANESELVNLGEPIYFGASLETVGDLLLFIESCWATPVGYMLDDRRYDIITDGCADDSTVVFHDNFGPAFQAFQIDAFTFIGDYPQVFVHCNVLVCDQSDVTSRCTMGCLPRTRRSVRQLGASSKPHAVTNGPLSAASQLPGQISSNQGENEIRPSDAVSMTILVSLLMVIALLLLLVLAMMYRRSCPKALGYRRVGVEPLDP